MVTRPHETPFKYDDALLVSCATSPLAQSLMSPKKEMVSSVLSPHNMGNTSDCLELLNQHASHYNRSPLSMAESKFWNVWTSTDEQRSQAASNNNESIHEVMMSSRHTAFMQSVIFVHRHNTDANTVNNLQHKVALNRFSDVPSHEYPLPSEHPQQIIHHREGIYNDQSMFNLNDPISLHLNEEKDIMEIASKLQRVHSNKFSTTTTTKTAAASSSNNNHYLSLLVPNIIETIKDSWWWIGDGQLSAKSTSSSSLSDTSGEEPNLKRHKNVKNGKKTTFVFDKQNELSGSDGNNVKDNGSSSSTNKEEEDRFKTYLNWATTDNPDGVSIVHPPIEQGSCGSCWAVSSLGTMEASIARNMAYIGYEAAYNEAVKSVQRHLDEVGEGGAVEEGSDEDVLSNKTDDEEEGDTLSPSISFDESRTLAVLAAQQVERKSIELADLSVQELIDCDTRYDQGCGGGNPQLAFYYLHKHGVTSSKNYPYVGTQNVCKQHKVGQPIAKVESWGVLTPDHENNLEKVLRYIGPVAVGLGAYDAAFLSYSGGVFASTEGSRCNKLVADHAMLIVGYGEEVMSNGTKMKVSLIVMLDFSFSTHHLQS